MSLPSHGAGLHLESDLLDDLGAHYPAGSLQRINIGALSKLSNRWQLLAQLLRLFWVKLGVGNDQLSQSFHVGGVNLEQLLQTPGCHLRLTASEVEVSRLSPQHAQIGLRACL